MGTMLIRNVGNVRRATLNGRKYLVANTTIIVPGVLNGSKGSLYYPPEEVSHPACVDAWNGIPLMNGHPTDESGQHVSARSPRIMESHGLGHVYNSRINRKTGSQRVEAWFDVEAIQRVEPRILAALKQGKPVEVSTGLFTQDEPAPRGSVHNGKSYDFVARKYRPDHLAILIDQEGACSLRDGCGVMVENSATANCGGPGSGKPGPCPDRDDIDGKLDPKGAAQFTPDYLRLKSKAKSKKMVDAAKAALESIPDLKENCGGKGGKPGPCPDPSKQRPEPTIDMSKVRPQNLAPESAEYTALRERAGRASYQALMSTTPTTGDTPKFDNAARVASKLADRGGKGIDGRTDGGRHSSLHRKAASAHAKAQAAHKEASSKLAITRPDDALKHAKASEAHGAASAAHTKAGHELMIVGNKMIKLNCGGPGSGKPGPCPFGGSEDETGNDVKAAQSASNTAKEKTNALSLQTDKNNWKILMHWGGAGAYHAEELAKTPASDSAKRLKLSKMAAEVHLDTARLHNSIAVKSKGAKSQLHSQAADAHKTAANAYRKLITKLTPPTTNNSTRTQPMKKTEAIEFLTTNCDCWKPKAAGKTLATLNEDQLSAMVTAEQERAAATQLATAVRNRLGEKAATLTVNQLAETLEDADVTLELEDELAENCDGDMMEGEETAETEEEAAPPAKPFGKKKKKGPPMPPAMNSEQPVRRLTMAEWESMAPVEVLERDRRAKQVVNGERDRIVAKLVANSAARTKDAKDQLRKALNAKSLDDLNLMAMLQVNRKSNDPDRAPTSVPNFAGLGHSYEEPVYNEGINEDGTINDEDGMLVHNTASVKWADEVKLYAPVKKAM